MRHFPNSSDPWTPFLWILYQSTLEDHAVIHFTVNNVSVIPVSENPRGTVDVENSSLAKIRMPGSDLDNLEAMISVCGVEVENDCNFYFSVTYLVN